MTEIFVFGSNLAGRHGKGAALEAVKKHGAKYGVGVGPKGNSYAIPTKDERLRTLPLDVIEGHVSNFLAWARGHLGWTFNVTRVGCGLAGYKDEDIAPMFRGAPVNCKLDPAWEQVLGRTLMIQGPPGDFLPTHGDVIRESYKPRPDEKPNDYWERISKEASMLLSFEDLRVGIARKAEGCARVMPISLAIPLVKFPPLLDMRVCVDTTSLKPDENVRFTWSVADRDAHRVQPPIRVTRTDWAPDVNDWKMLARFFHSNYTAAVQHEVDETFKFQGERVFDPHVLKEGDLRSLDHHILSLHHQATARRQKYHDLSR